MYLQKRYPGILLIAIVALLVSSLACNLSNLQQQGPYDEPPPVEEELYEEPPEGEEFHDEGEPEPPEGEHPEEVFIEFEAERTHLAPGECTLLFWHVEGGFGVFLNGEEVERGGDREVCLTETEPFFLAVDLGEKMDERVIEIFVEGDPAHEGEPPEGEPPPGEEHPPEGEPPPGEEHPPEGEPPPEGEQPPEEPQMNDEEAIRQALLAELGWSESELQFDIGRMDENFAEGGVSRGGELGGAMWLAAKDHGQWVIVHHGQDLPSCGKADAYNFPPEWIPYCWDEATNTSVER